MSNTVVGAGVQTDPWQRTPETPMLGGAMSSRAGAGGTPTKGTSGARDRANVPQALPRPLLIQLLLSTFIISHSCPES